MTAYSPQVAEKICDLIADGRSLRSIVQLEGMPSKRSVFNWLRTHEEFRTIYAIAVDERTEGDFEEAKEIADGINIGEAGDGKVQVMRDTLRVNTIKWRVARMNPKKYGDRLEHQLDAGSGLLAVLAGLSKTDES